LENKAEEAGKNSNKRIADHYTFYKGGLNLKLEELFEGVDYEIISGDPGIEISGVQYDSRKATPACLFVAITGFKTDGHLFVADAIKKGAVAVLVEKEIEVPSGILLIRTANTRKALAFLARNYYGKPDCHASPYGIRSLGRFGNR
jgi:UDP-N-acetylmuramoyl-L-alanyl-D-glutamate--2,6-diaminopimelate ligase